MKQVAADSGIIMTQAWSHIAALLFYVEYGLRAREERSCTDGSKSWFPPAMKKLGVRPVAEMGLSSAMKKWRIDTATSQLVHRSLDRDQFFGVLIAAEYRPAVASTYVSSHASPFPAVHEQCAARISPSPLEPHFDGRLDAGLRVT
ncbi:hypothetical protein HPB52_008286 [Rhipicephalus sanguineus]|uniref:Uncharacterized protein n=1 Tax=Rhipicephalus sanguineus TaxID=34632 RepID=A0A9D4T1V5_RHISA|nr:hypothetical protein HPB52_008286 [Rhipicephalus sanguineus]